MSSARRITVEFLGDSRNLNSALDSSSRRTSSWGDKLKRVGKLAAVGLAVGAVVAGKALWDMSKAAAEDEASQKKLATALRNATGASDEQIASVEKLIDATSRQFGVADDELRPAMQRLVESSGSVKTGYDQLRLAMDVAAGTGKPLKTVTEALTKANNGSTGSLSRLGVKMKDAEGNTLSLKEATKQMAETFGGQAAQKADTFQGKMDRLKVVFDETKETIGAKLLPMLTDLAGWFLEKGIPAISKASDWIGKKLGPVFEWVGDTIRTKLMPFLRDVGASIGEDLPGYVASAKGAFKDAQPFFEALGTIFQNVVGPAIKWVARNVLPMAANNLKILGKVFGAIGSIFKWTWNNVMQPVFKFLVLAIAKVMDVFGDMLQALSHVPGFGWAKDAADKLHRAADETRGFADALKKIPPRVNTTITTTYVSRQGPGGQGAGGGLGGGDPALPKSGGGRSTSKGKGSTFGTSTAGRISSKSGGAMGTGGGITINFNGIVTDPRAVAREIQRVLLAEKRLTGTPLGLA